MALTYGVLYPWSFSPTYETHRGVIININYFKKLKFNTGRGYKFISVHNPSKSQACQIKPYIMRSREDHYLQNWQMQIEINSGLYDPALELKKLKNRQLTSFV